MALVVLAVLCAIGRPARAQEWVAPVAVAGSIGAITLVPTAFNGLVVRPGNRPPVWSVVAGYAMGSLSVGAGAIMAAFAHRAVDRGPAAEPGDPLPMYAAGGGLVAVGVLCFAVTALAELFAVNRTKVAGLLLRDAGGRLAPFVMIGLR